MTFDEATGFLTRLGVMFGQDYDYGKRGTDERHRFDVPMFASFVLPFTSEEWCSLCMREGDDYVGGCCGNMSAAQDIVSDAFRFGGGRINGYDLAKLVELMASHDGGSEGTFTGLARPVAEAVERALAKRPTPWEMIALVWHIAKEHVAPEVPHAMGKHLSPIENAVHTLGRGLRRISFEDVFKTDIETVARTSQHRASRAILLFKLLPALKIVWERIDELDLGSFEGFALVDKNKGQEAVAENSWGLCIFETHEEVDDLLRLWREQEKEYEERTERSGRIDDRIGVRRVRVSKERGLEFLDEGL